MEPSSSSSLFPPIVRNKAIANSLWLPTANNTQSKEHAAAPYVFCKTSDIPDNTHALTSSDPAYSLPHLYSTTAPATVAAGNLKPIGNNGVTTAESQGPEG